MKKILYILTFLIFIKPTFAEFTAADLRKKAFGEYASVSNIWYGQNGPLYDNDDGSQAVIGTSIMFGRIQYFLSKYDPVEKKANNDSGWRYFDVTVNGAYPEGASSSEGRYARLDFDENGRLQARYNSGTFRGYYQDENGQTQTLWNKGDLKETYKYASNGQMLVYNAQGELIGAYDNFYERHLSEFNVYDKKTKLNHIDENGNYTAKDGYKVLGIYKADGGVVEYKYDKGGNLISIYDNGVATYRRRIYKPSEATATASGNKNTFSITYR